MFAVIHLPQFRMQAVLRHAMEDWAKPVALVDPTLTTPRVCEFTEPARREGIEPGLTPTQALARCRTVSIRHRSLSQESALTDALLQCAGCFSPHIEHTAPGIVTLDLRGLSELSTAFDAASSSTSSLMTEPSPDLTRWASRLQSALTSLQLTVCLGLGPTPNIARHAALWAQSPGKPARGPIQIVTDAPAFIDTLPIAALQPSTDVAGILQKWGIHTVGQLRALGQEAVMDRLGLEAIALFAAASVQGVRPLNLVRPVETYEESHEFEPAIETVEPLLFLLNRFVDQLSHRLSLGSMAAGLLTLRLQLDSGERLERRLPVPQPTCRSEVLFRMLQTHLETLRTDSPIAGVTLIASPTRPEQKQFSLFEAALRDPLQFQETLARLSALVGPGRVGTPVRENSHRPDAFQLIPPDFENTPAPLPRRTPDLLRPTPLRRLRPPVPAIVELPEDPPRAGSGASDKIVDLIGPLFRAPVPEQAGARPEAVEGMASMPVPPATTPPLALHCKVARGKLTIALGPWRASGHWWEPGAWQRDEWDVQTHDGQALRLVQHNGQWRVEAVAD